MQRAGNSLKRPALPTPANLTERGKREPVPISTATRKSYGASYFLDWIGGVTGVIDDLRTCFPDAWRQILSLVYCLILEDRNPLSRFPRWRPAIGILAGNIPDVKALTKPLVDMITPGCLKINVILERRFHSTAHINELYRQHLNFFVGGKLSLPLVQSPLDKVCGTMRNWTHYSQTCQLYACSLPISWQYSQDYHCKEDAINGDRRLCLHLSYTANRALEDEKAFNSRLAALQKEFTGNQRHQEHDKL